MLFLESVVSAIIVVFIDVTAGELVTLLACDEVSGVAALVALIGCVSVLTLVDCVVLLDDSTVPDVT